jgi:NAD-dependent SIR2 family protein deacetylase
LSDNEQRNTDTIFLFGAGASVDAGIPDTYTFVSEFEEYINQHHSDFRELLSSIVKIRKKFNQRINDKDESEVDIEQLLDTIRRLIERENEPLLDFYTEKRFSLNVEQNKFTKIKDLLENFIRERVIIEDESKLEYLKELLKFDKPIEIYSTNYDTCIEQLSHIHHMRYTDGFSIYWDEKLILGKTLILSTIKCTGRLFGMKTQKRKNA